MKGVRVEDIVKKRVVKAKPSATIKDVAEVMCESGSTYVLLGDKKNFAKSKIFVPNQNVILSDSGEGIKGIITEGDLKRAIAQGIDTSSKASSVASEIIIKIDKGMGVEDAAIEFFKNKIKHLPVTDNGKIVGVLNISDLTFFMSKSPLYFLKEFSRAKSIEDMKESYRKFQRYVLKILPKEFGRGGVDSQYMGHMISMINDEILVAVMRACIRDLGEPPCKFSFFVTGSEGRREQLLRTDQDNALIFEKKECEEYFIKLGKKIHSHLLEIGFLDCPEGYTVGNANWVMPLKEWLAKMEHWTFSLDAKDLLNLSVFADMRHVHGDEELFGRLRKRLFSLCSNERIFTSLLGVSLEFSIPGKPKEINLKNEGLLPLIAPIRIMSLKFNIKSTNTFERIEELCAKGHIRAEQASNLKIAYNFLKVLHFTTHIENINKGRDKVNRLDIKDIPKIKAKFLKDSLKTLSEFQGPMRGKLRWTASGFV